MKKYLTINCLRMKKVFIFLSLFFVILYAQAQEWGIRAAFDINIPSKLGGRLNGEKLDLFRIGYGGTLGAVYTYWFNDKIFLEPGASLFYDTYSFKDLIIMDEPAGVSETDPSLYKLGLRIPLVIGYSYYLLDDLPMRVFTGPELSYAFAGNVRIKNKQSPDDDLDLSLFGKKGFMNHVDCAWKIGLGIETQYALISFDVALGLTDLYKDHLTLHDNRVTISLTRYF